MARRRNAVLETLVLFKALNPGATLTHLIAFLYVAENEGLNVAELADVMGMTRATASRVARALAAPGRHDSVAPGLDLVEITPNPEDPRGRMIALAPAGRRMAERIDQVIRRGQTMFEAPAEPPLRRQA